jgi:carbon-monoxide dehydrogenase large subunit
MPAVINAVVDALHERTGVLHLDMPATAERVWEALAKAG